MHGREPWPWGDQLRRRKGFAFARLIILGASVDILACEGPTVAVSSRLASKSRVFVLDLPETGPYET